MESKMTMTFMNPIDETVLDIEGGKVVERCTLADLIAQHSYMEKLCEGALTEQDELAHRFYSSAAASAKDLVEVKSGRMEPRNQLSISDLAFDDFRQVNRLARKVVPQGLPNANSRFMINACTPEFEQIEYLEESIKIYRYQMTLIEQEILESVPPSKGEAVAKLKFMANLMVDGGEIETDYFAYLVDECASVIGAHLDRP